MSEKSEGEKKIVMGSLAVGFRKPAGQIHWDGWNTICEEIALQQIRQPLTACHALLVLHALQCTHSHVAPWKRSPRWGVISGCKPQFMVKSTAQFLKAKRNMTCAWNH
eukprot:335955-Pelagomonas_calceolata.AAC.2